MVICVLKFGDMLTIAYARFYSFKYILRSELFGGIYAHTYISSIPRLVAFVMEMEDELTEEQIVATERVVQNKF